MPHILLERQKRIRVEESRALLRELRIQTARSWHDIITLDESWFYFIIDYELIWLAQRQEIPERERHIMQSPKMTITIVWIPTGFRIVDILLKDSKFNAHHYISVIPQSVSDWRVYEVGETNRKLIVHADNARSHMAKVLLTFKEQNAMKRTPYPLYFSGLVPSDFFLFCNIKRILSVALSSHPMTFCQRFRSSWRPSKKLSCWTFSLSRCEGWNNIAISLETTPNDINNHAFLFAFFRVGSRDANGNRGHLIFHCQLSLFNLEN
jgi:hypothetical protein